MLCLAQWFATGGLLVQRGLETKQQDRTEGLVESGTDEEKQLWCFNKKGGRKHIRMKDRGNLANRGEMFFSVGGERPLIILRGRW